MKVYSEHCTQNIKTSMKQYKQAHLSTMLQVGLLLLCFGWPTPKGWWNPWPMGFTTFSFMVIYLIHEQHHYWQSLRSPWQIILNVFIEVRMSLLRALITSVFLYGCETETIKAEITSASMPLRWTACGGCYRFTTLYTPQTNKYENWWRDISASKNICWQQKKEANNIFVFSCILHHNLRN
jgi:hypothetical protein